MKREPTVLTVSQVTTYIRALLEGDERLESVYICGEISNYTNHLRSGHWYFSLKDEDSVIRAVMFRSANQRLRFRPENGMRVMVRGRVTVYERDGAYQLYVEDMQPDGAGALAVAFEQLRRRLEGEGLFAPERKRPLPLYPLTIGVITSPIGAARRDIENVLARRFPAAEVLLIPVLVQGVAAPEQLVRALELVNDDGRAEVIIIGRGGGSAEELWAFNDERVVRAVAASHIPVISAVGHETDVTLCDFAADCRAPTPSAAAELAVPNGENVRAQLRIHRERMGAAWSHLLDRRQRELQLLAQRPVLKDPAHLLDGAQHRLQTASTQLFRIGKQLLDLPQHQLRHLAGRLDALSPLRVLARGYAAVRREEWIADAAKLTSGDVLTVVFHDGEADCTVTEVRAGKENRYGEERDI